MSVSGFWRKSAGVPLCWRKITADLSVLLDSSLHVCAEVLPDWLGMGQDRLCVFPSLPLKEWIATPLVW